jgi:aryl-phospho-beta-D-glucosidase BglC (GH1 family)
MKIIILTLLGCLAVTQAWLPTNSPFGKNLRAFCRAKKIRGANLGSQFIIEPYMAADDWLNMGCGQFPEDSAAKAERDCIENQLRGRQSQANKVWHQHWGSWTKQSDFATMISYGLNTIRIPVGY